MTVTIRYIRPEDWALLRVVRLRALADAPYAFGTSLEEAQQMTDDQWQARAARNARGTDSTCALAFDRAEPVGMAAGFLDGEDRSRAHLVAMWVAPSYRGTGLASAIVERIAAWARGVGVTVLAATVTEHNGRAIAFYEKVGFQFLPERRPWRRDPSKDEIAIELDVDQGDERRTG